MLISCVSLSTRPRTNNTSSHSHQQGDGFRKKKCFWFVLVLLCLAHSSLLAACTKFNAGDNASTFTSTNTSMPLHACTSHHDCRSCYSQSNCWWTTPPILGIDFMNPPQPSCVSMAIPQLGVTARSLHEEQVTRVCEAFLNITSPVSGSDSRVKFLNFINMTVTFHARSVSSVILRLHFQPFPSVTVNYTYPVVDGFNQIEFYPLNPWNLTWPKMECFISLSVPHSDFGWNLTETLDTPYLIVVSSTWFSLASCISTDCLSCMAINDAVDRMVPFPFDTEPNRCIWHSNVKFGRVDCMAQARVQGSSHRSLDQDVHSRAGCISVSVADSSGSPPSSKLIFYSSEAVRVRYSLGGKMAVFLNLVSTNSTSQSNTTIVNGTIDSLPLMLIAGPTFSPLLGDRRYFMGTSFGKSNYDISFRVPPTLPNGSYAISLQVVAKPYYTHAPWIFTNSISSAVSQTFDIVQGARPIATISSILSPPSRDESVPNNGKSEPTSQGVSIISASPHQQPSGGILLFFFKVLLVVSAICLAADFLVRSRSEHAFTTFVRSFRQSGDAQQFPASEEGTRLLSPPVSSEAVQQMESALQSRSPGDHVRADRYVSFTCDSSRKQFASETEGSTHVPELDSQLLTSNELNENVLADRTYYVRQHLSDQRSTPFEM